MSTPGRTWRGAPRRLRAAGRSRLAVAATLAGVLAAASATGCAPPTSEDAVREVLGELRDAAAAGDTGGVLAHVSDLYRDAAGRDKPGVRGLLMLHLHRYESPYVFVQERSLDLETPDVAHVSALVAVAATPVGSASALDGIAADLLRIDFSLGREPAGWKVLTASWEPAALSDFRLDG